MNKNSKIILSLLAIIILIVGVVVYFKTNTYSVNFYSDGELIQTIETRKNKVITQPDKPEKDGYVFIGWYAEDGEVFNFENTINQNINLFARWATIVLDE